ncbi:TPA: AAA family ATPase [Enterococcus faecium]
MLKGRVLPWIKKQPYWLQVIADTIFKGEKLNKNSLDEIYIIFKQEVGLVQEKLKKENLAFLISKNADDSTVKMNWDSITDIQGVNALKAGETLEIGKQLTLIYGENGSGKSGYTRLLNNAFVSRGDKTIVSNIFKDKEVIEPSAVFKFSDSHKEVELSFPDDRNSSLFNSVAVFDAIGAVYDLTNENELSFVPIDFNFFDELIHAFLEIKTRLTDEITKNEIVNELVNYFDKDTLVKKSIESLNGCTDYEEIKKIADVSSLGSEYEVKVKRKIELQGLNIDKKLKEYEKITQGLNNIKEKIFILSEEFSKEKISATKELLDQRELFTKLSLSEGLKQFEGEHVYGLGSIEWKKFIQAAKTYYESINEQIDNCIFCGQNILEVELIDKYWKYLKSSAEKQLNIVESNIKEAKQKFISQNFDLIIAGSRIEEWLIDNQLELYEYIISIKQEFKQINSVIVDNLSNLTWNELVEKPYIDLSKFNKTMEVIEESIRNLNVSKVKTELHDIDNFLDEYTDKLKLEKLLPKVEDYINKMKWLDLARQINLSTRNITIFQNSLFSEYISSEYIKKFDDECKNLNANFSAEIQQRGQRGTTLCKLSIKGRKPVEILSEGEQRSIALANFLAETGLNKDNICIVFDDPVCSLDYKRREIIAKRLVEEAGKKQVVILTHDLTFLLSVQSHCDNKGIECCINTIRKLKDETGIVQKESIPWIGMPINKRIKYLRADLQNIKKFYNDIHSGDIGKMEEYEKKAKLWCELLRETWERSIEENLFNNSVQRFSPAIQTQRLRKALFTKELYLEVERGMTDCSNWVHDRAAGLGENIPEPEQLEKYLKACECFVKTNNPNK